MKVSHFIFIFSHSFHKRMKLVFDIQSQVTWPLSNDIPKCHNTADALRCNRTVYLYIRGGDTPFSGYHCSNSDMG